MFKLNQKGMTLVETMVAAGLLGGLAVAGMTLFKTQTKAQKTVEQNYETTATLGAIRSILADLTNCQLTLGNKTPVLAWNSVAPPAITRITKRVNGVDSFVYTRNTDLPGTSLRITSYALSQSYPGLETATATGGETMLEINFSRGNNVQVDAIRKTVRINYSAAAGVITSCYAVTSGASDSLWQIEGTGPDIFYPVGNVGIGTSTPTVPLQVERTEAAGARHEVARFSLTDSTGPATRSLSVNLPMGGVQGFGLSWNTNSRFDLTPTSGTPAISINGTNGYVGVGTTLPNSALHVNSGTDDTVAAFVSSDNQARISLQDPTGSAFMYVSGTNRFLQLGHISNLGDGLFIRDDGNVGIGDNLPTQKLMVRGNGQFRGSAQAHTTTIGEAGGSAALLYATGYLGWNSTRDSTTSSWSLRSDGANNGGSAILGSITGNLRFIATPSTGAGNQVLTDAQMFANTKMTITPAGNVGIGISNPAIPLHINHTGDSPQAITVGDVNTTTSQTGIYLRSTSEANIIRGTNAALIFRRGGLPGVEEMRLINGNLGIGTTNPTDMLTVQGNVNIGGTTNSRLLVRHIDGKDATTAGFSNLYLNYSNGMHVFIGNPGVSTSNLNVSGTVQATNYLYYSDRKLKEQIEDLRSPLERVLKLRGRSFEWKLTGEKDIGFIAQEVNEVEPSLVKGEDSKYLSVKYANITALLVEAMKEIKRFVDELFESDAKQNAELAMLKKKNDELEARLKAQETRLEKQEKLLEQLTSK